jgi:SAM-dependent methyltransferase
VERLVRLSARRAGLSNEASADTLEDDLTSYRSRQLQGCDRDSDHEDMSTDTHWEAWGSRDPYYGVITDPKFRSAALTPEAREAFFRSGHDHVAHVMATIRVHIDPEFAPRRVLDFGCGVGRVLGGLAEIAPEVLGIDVSPSMLAEARRNCDDHGISHVQLALSDDDLSNVEGDFDLVHTFIVLQHLEIARGRRLFQQLLRRIRPGGVGALHVTFGLAMLDQTFGKPPATTAIQAPPARGIGWIRPRTAPPSPKPPDDQADPEMQMNWYNMSELMYLLKAEGAEHFFAELTDHGGALGAFLFFRRSDVNSRS